MQSLKSILHVNFFSKLIYYVFSIFNDLKHANRGKFYDKNSFLLPPVFNKVFYFIGECIMKTIRFIYTSY